MQTWFAFSMMSLILFGLSGVTQKVSTNHISFQASFAWFCAAMILISALVAVAIPMDSNLSRGLAALAAFGGLLNGLGVLTSFAALERGGKASVVIPIINLYPIVTVVGAWLFLGEKLNATQIAGIVFALAAVVFLSQETPPAGAPGTPAAETVLQDGTQEGLT